MLNAPKPNKFYRLIAIPLLCYIGSAQTQVRIDADHPKARLSPGLYGLMTEEINYSYEGGLYGELIRNRSMKEDAANPAHWSVVQENGAAASIALDPGNPLNGDIATSLKLTIQTAAGKQRAGVANEGFWGIPVRPSTRYKASLYAKAASGFAGPLTLAIVSNDGNNVLASTRISRVGSGWRKYDAVLTTPSGAPASAANRFVILADHPGTVWLNMVSLFPPTYANRANGNRRDLMELLAAMHPAFLRFPGGNYLEGNTIETRFNWKKTIGDVAHRPGHMDDAWHYWSTDGMGLLEFLDWCEDLHMDPVLAVYAGYSLHQQRVKPGADLQPYVQDALDEIEYVTGDAKKTRWGAERAKDGHPAPFHLEYVEIGNEDQFDREPGSYDGRFNQFFDAIRAKYPALKIIGTARTTTRNPDVIDEHYYRRSEDEMASHAHDYDSRPRTGQKVFVGEWATRVGDPTPNMSAALGDAAWMTGMERNSDLVIMSSYAPLFVNVNPGGMQWRTDLIGYDTITSYGSPAYWAQQMFSSQHGDTILPLTAEGIPSREWQPPAGRGRGQTPPPPAPPPQQVPLLFFSATRDSRTGVIYVKMVNRADTAQPVHVSLSGAGSVEPKGQLTILAATNPQDTNSVAEPHKIEPQTSGVDGVGPEFARTLPPYSISVLRISAK